MPKKLEEILNGTPPEKMDSGVLTKIVLEHITELDRGSIARVVEKLPPFPSLLIMKERCIKAKDKEACIAYDIAINGDKTAPPGTPKYMGMRGLWVEQKNRFAKDYLERLGEL